MERNKMTEWRNVQIKDFCFFNPKMLISKGVVVKKIGMEKLTPFCRKIGGFTEEAYSSGAKFQNGDTLLARITPCLENGKTAFVDILEEGEIAFGSTEFIVLRKKDGISDALFLYYLAISPDFRERAISLMNGTSGRQRVEAAPLGEEFFSLPPLEIQKKIAGILGALDDKIEVLREQNKTLEQMAQAVFQSWFVDFDIVRAKAAGIPTADICKKYHITPDVCALFPSAFTPDNLPLGWEKIPFSEIMYIISGGTPKTTEATFWNGEIPWYSVVDTPTSVYVLDTEKHITKLGLEKSPCSLLEKNTVIISARGTVGKLAMVGNAMAMNQSCYGLKFDFPYYGFLTTKQMLKLLKQNVHGAVFDTITKETFKTVNALNVPISLKQAFENAVSAFFDKIYENSKQIRTLEQTRDALLPQLLGGKIEV